MLSEIGEIDASARKQTAAAAAEAACASWTHASAAQTDDMASSCAVDNLEASSSMKFVSLAFSVSRRGIGGASWTTQLNWNW